MKYKRLIDVLLATIGLVLVSPLLVLAWLGAIMDTTSNGIFTQTRIGQYGKPFTIYKLKTIHPRTQKTSKFGDFLRKSKIDEFPQLLNILKGDMSFVGPRPDIPGYADNLKEEDQIILHLRPGITGLASLKYRNEEQLLATKENPIAYNDTVIWPDKIRINKWYVDNYSFKLDSIILFYTLIPISFEVEKFIFQKKRMN